VCFEALDALGAEFAARLVVDGSAAQMHLASDGGKAKIDGSAVPGAGALRLSPDELTRLDALRPDEPVRPL
jgi:hypothetical protein